MIFKVLPSKSRTVNYYLTLHMIQKENSVKIILIHNVLTFLISINMQERLKEKFIEIGCTCLKNVAIGIQVYLELSEVKKYWDLEYSYNKDLNKLYFTARKKKNDPFTIFIPVMLSEQLSFEFLQKLLQVSNNTNKVVAIVIVNSDSTCVYYQLTEGLGEPPHTKSKSEDSTQKIDKLLKRNKSLIEQAALYGIPVTLPKETQNS